MHKKVLYFQVAGFFIKIVFILTRDNLEFEKRFVEKIESYYRNFLIEDCEKVDYVVEVVYEYAYKVVVNKKNKDTYIHFYKQLSRRKIRTFYHVSGSQFEVLIRKVTHELLVEGGGFILHASASKINEKAVVFLGDSGAGKSTTMRILASKFPPLGDDSIIIKREGKTFYCYSSTARERNDWFFKSYNKSNLGAIYFVEQSRKTAVLKINETKQVIKKIGRQLLSEEADISKQMENLIYLARTFDGFYRLEVSLEQQDKLVKLMETI